MQKFARVSSFHLAKESRHLSGLVSACGICHEMEFSRESHMRSHVKLFTVVVSAAFTLILGCGGSPHPYTLSSLTPSELVAGSSDFSLTLDGANFTKDTRVAFAGATLIPDYFASTQIRVTVPGSAVSKAGLVDVAVTGSSTSRALTFTITNPLPVVSALSQESIFLNSGSFSLDVQGSDFVTTSTVNLGVESLAPPVVTPTIATEGMERDGRGREIPVLTSSMLDAITGESGAGIYITQVMPH